MANNRVECAKYIVSSATVSGSYTMYKVLSRFSKALTAPPSLVDGVHQGAPKIIPQWPLSTSFTVMRLTLRNMVPREFADFRVACNVTAGRGPIYT